jgi:hypothetical protein
MGRREAGGVMPIFAQSIWKDLRSHEFFQINEQTGILEGEV